VIDVAWHPFRNPGLKLLAVAIATVLWLAVTRDQVAERSLRVPLEYQNMPADLELTGDPPGNVDVRVRGASSILSRLEPGEVVAVLDLRGARPGQRMFHVLSDEVRVPFGIEVAQVTPPSISLSFERSGSRVVPVRASVDGEPAAGYTIGRITTEPATVEVIGAASRLGDTNAAMTEPVSVQGATRRVRDTVNIGVADPGVRLREPRSAVVTVEILPAPIERALHDVEVAIRGTERPRRGSVVPPRVTVYLRGNREAVGALTGGQIGVWVDATRLGPGRYNLPVKVESAETVTVLRTEPATVQVRIQ
jgi:hypothetical protein